MINAIQVTPAGSASHVEIDGLEDMQDAVDGVIEFVSHPDDDFEVIVNEDGLALNLELNTLASVLTGRRLVGTVLFVGRADRGGNTTSVPKGTMSILHQASMIMEMAGRPVGHPSWEQVQ
jgi:cobyric acid synthase